MGRLGRAFKPYKMPGPPAGSYDPSLDSALAAAHRGYGDFQQDTGLADTRAGVDYGTAVAQTDENYSTNTGLLKRSFDQLANRQAEGANAFGVINGGAMLQSVAKRAANQQIQQTSLDTAHTRAIGALGLDYERGVADRSTALSRAGREDRRFGIDTAAQKSYQAAQSGYVPPGKGEPGGMPANEFHGPGGPFRAQTIGGRKARVHPDGSVTWLEPPRRGGRGRNRGPNTAAGRGWV